MTSKRTETDAFGPIEVDATRYWGAQTQRSLQNFEIGEPSRDRMPYPVIQGFGVLKKCCAKYNVMHGKMEPAMGEAIAAAADEVISGALRDHFPLVTFQTGSGTQSNMNCNEVISNRAIELLTGSRAAMGSKSPVHPNDHVNMGQSSNDSFPTAMHIAAARQWHSRLLPGLAELASALEEKAAAWHDIVKIGRTHAMDATPLTLGQEFSGYAAQLRNGIRRAEQCLPALYQVLLHV